jgi:hypothetical protein
MKEISKLRKIKLNSRRKLDPQHQLLICAIKSVFYPQGIPRLGRKPKVKLTDQEKFRHCIYNPKPRSYYNPAYTAIELSASDEDPLSLFDDIVANLNGIIYQLGIRGININKTPHAKKILNAH